VHQGRFVELVLARRHGFGRDITLSCGMETYGRMKTLGTTPPPSSVESEAIIMFKNIESLFSICMGSLDNDVLLLQLIL
jgi:hypothetical protein